MYKYYLKLRFSKSKCLLDFIKCKPILQQACDTINMGVTFKRENKQFLIKDVYQDYAIIILLSEKSLLNPKRSVSAITRFLTTHYPNVFKDVIYNKTIFSIELLSISRVTDQYIDNIENITKEDTLKAIIDLFYNFSVKSTLDSKNREKTIESIKTIMLPYIKKRK